jgi:hypothetical protein
LLNVACSRAESQVGLLRFEVIHNFCLEFGAVYGELFQERDGARAVTG